MKQVLTFLFVLLMVSCGSNSNQDTSSSAGDSTKTLKKEIPSCPLLLAAAEKHPGIKDSLTLYLGMISEVIENENRIKEIFSYREQLMDRVDRLVVEFLNPNTMDYNEALEKELNSIGFQGRYAEGMYFELGVAPILEEEIERVASEEYKLKIAFDVAVASAYDTEYPFDSMDDEMEIVKIGEQINKKFPGSKTAEYIKTEFMQAVSCFTDFHVVIDPERNDSTYIVGGIDVDFYPAGSYRSNFQSFITEMPQSKYTKVVKSVLKNPSTILYNEDFLLYLVVVEMEDDYDQAEEKIFSYIEKGIDIPHHIIITDKENINHAIVYRFFTDLNKAQKALDYIIKNYKNAQIIPVDRSGKMVTLSDK